MLKKIVLLVGVVGILGVGACHKMGGHRDPNKMIDKVSQRIEKKLELRAEQKPAFAALVEKVRAHAVAQQQKGKASLLEVKKELDKDAVDIARIAGLAKERVRDRATDQQIEAFIDEVAAFYKSLDPQQQKIVADLARDKLEWLE